MKGIADDRTTPVQPTDPKTPSSQPGERAYSRKIDCAETARPSAPERPEEIRRADDLPRRGGSRHSWNC